MSFATPSEREGGFIINQSFLKNRLVQEFSKQTISVQLRQDVLKKIINRHSVHSD